MTVKAFKYRHEKACQGQLSEKAAKPHTKPKAKPKPKPEQKVMSEQRILIQEHEEISEQQTPKIETPQQKQQQLPPSNPLMSHYQSLQQQYMQQKQERFNNLFEGMVNGSRKKSWK